MMASASATRLTAGTELRAADASDAEFLRRVHAATREAEMGLLDWPEAAKAHFLRQQFDAQDAHYRAHYPGGRSTSSCRTASEWADCSCIGRRPKSALWTSP